MALTTAAAMAALFNTIPTIDKLVQSFDFENINVREETRQDFLSVGLAPSYGTLTSESIKELDDELKVMIAGAVKTLAQLPPNARSWDMVVSTLLNCPLLEPDGDAIERSDKLIKPARINAFKFDGSPDAGIVNEVKTWFTNLINDEDVLKSTSIDIGILANLVAKTGATVDDFGTFFYKNERKQKTLLDIGVLRFPDLNNPHFKVYRIQLTAWAHSERVLMVQEDCNGITGEYAVRKFKPRESVIKSMTAKALDRAISEANNLFAELDDELTA